ncbi:MAG: hypothetical protein PWQ58_474 [Archaeoglobaceae archaeon]|nr:hypothetical protein [Archaeoglobaceae archaeon]
MKDLIYDEKDGVGFITLNRPEKRNALSMELLEELKELIEGISKKRDVKVVVLKGAGKDFSSGHDLREILNAHPIDVERLFLKCYEVMLAIRNSPQVYIAMVRGNAAAAGCQLVAACDLAVASDNARFSTPGIKIGLFCFTPIAFVSRNVGRKKAFELGFTGEAITAEEALRIGLVNKVVPDDQLESETEKLARKIASYAFDVIASGKRFFYSQLFMEDFQALKYATEAIALYSSSKEAKEGFSQRFYSSNSNLDFRPVNSLFVIIILSQVMIETKA